MAIVTVVERPDLDYNVSLDGTLQHESTTRLQLRGQLAHYNIVGKLYNDVLTQLAMKGKASVQIPLGRFEQVQRSA